MGVAAARSQVPVLVDQLLGPRLFAGPVAAVEVFHDPEAAEIGPIADVFVQADAKAAGMSGHRNSTAFPGDFQKPRSI